MLVCSKNNAIILAESIICPPRKQIRVKEYLTFVSISPPFDLSKSYYLKLSAWSIAS
jgi:hypothetical protein